jgi:hypothetical protein
MKNNTCTSIQYDVQSAAKWYNMSSDIQSTHVVTVARFRAGKTPSIGSKS